MGSDRVLGRQVRFGGQHERTASWSIAHHARRLRTRDLLDQAYLHPHGDEIQLRNRV